MGGVVELELVICDDFAGAARLIEELAGGEIDDGVGGAGYGGCSLEEELVIGPLRA